MVLHFIRARRGNKGLVAYGQTLGVYPFGLPAKGWLPIPNTLIIR